MISHLARGKSFPFIFAQLLCEGYSTGHLIKTHGVIYGQVRYSTLRISLKAVKVKLLWVEIHGAILVIKVCIVRLIYYW